MKRRANGPALTPRVRPNPPAELGGSIIHRVRVLIGQNEHALKPQMNTPSNPRKGGSVIALDTGSVSIRMHDSKTTIEYTRPYTRVIRAA
jgi:hypothetical protein